MTDAVDPKPVRKRSRRPLVGPAAREKMARRLEATVERELPAVEAALKGAAGAGLPEDAERAARILASLVKTLGELRRLDAGRPMQPQEEAEADAPQTLAALRDELAQRLDRLR